MPKPKEKAEPIFVYHLYEDHDYEHYTISYHQTLEGACLAVGDSDAQWRRHVLQAPPTATDSTVQQTERWTWTDREDKTKYVIEKIEVKP